MPKLEFVQKTANVAPKSGPGIPGGNYGNVRVRQNWAATIGASMKHGATYACTAICM